MKLVKAFAPANISCIFRLYESSISEKKGSLGIGFTLDKGVTVSVKQSKKTRIRVNGKTKRFGTVKSVLKRLSDEPIDISIKADVPFGSGFGMSGASALATAYAVNKLLNLKKSKRELAMIAHISEVENSTGRGDVAGQFNGGIMIKAKKGKPLDVEKLRIRQKVIYYKVFGEIDTKKVINSKAKVDKINMAGDMALKKIKKVKKLDFGKVIEISKEFSEKSDLLRSKKVINTIEMVEKKGEKASMIMLGESVFSNIPFKGSKKAKIINKGARLL